MQAAPEPTTLQVVLSWLDWKVLGVIGLLLLALLHKPLRSGLAAWVASWRGSPPAPPAAP